MGERCGVIARFSGDGKVQVLEIRQGGEEEGEPDVFIVVVEGGFPFALPSALEDGAGVEAGRDCVDGGGRDVDGIGALKCFGHSKRGHAVSEFGK